MTTVEIGTKLVALCSADKNLEAIETLYASDVVSVEAQPNPGTGKRETKGIQACLAKGELWRENTQVHHAVCDGPYPHDDRFAVVFTYDVTPKALGKRLTMKEVAIYTVKDDKIIREEFFYVM